MTDETVVELVRDAWQDFDCATVQNLVDVTQLPESDVWKAFGVLWGEGFLLGPVDGIYTKNILTPHPDYLTPPEDSQK